MYEHHLLRQKDGAIKNYRRDKSKNFLYLIEEQINAYYKQDYTTLKDNLVGFIDVSAPLSSTSGKDSFKLKYVNAEGKQSLSEYYEIRKQADKPVKGYLLTEDDLCVGFSAPSNVYPLIFGAILILIIAIVLAFVLRKPKAPEEAPVEEPATEETQDVGLGQVETVTTADMGSISVPGYVDFTVSLEAPNVVLLNPEENDVYFHYDIMEGDQCIYDIEQLKPGDKEEVPLGTMLEPGEHIINFNLSCTDVETGTECNGANQPVKVIVEGAPVSEMETEEEVTPDSDLDVFSNEE